MKNTKFLWKNQPVTTLPAPHLLSLFQIPVWIAFPDEKLVTGTFYWISLGSIRKIRKRTIRKSAMEFRPIKVKECITIGWDDNLRSFKLKIYYPLFYPSYLRLKCPTFKNTNWLSLKASYAFESIPENIRLKDIL